MIYFYYGENEFTLRRQVEDVAAKFAENYGEAAITRLDISEVEPQNLIAEIVNINMFAPQRLIIVRGAETARTTWDQIGDNLNRVPDGTDLIIIAVKPDKRTKTYKNLLKSARLQEFPVLQGSSLQRWLIDEALMMRIKIDAEAVDELLAITSGDSDQQARLSAEIAKLQILGRPISVDLVRQMVEPNLAVNAFDILNLAVLGKRREVATKLKNLRDLGEDANKFFGLLSSQVFALAAVIFVDSSAGTARTLRIHPFQLTKMRDLAREFDDMATGKRRVKKITRIFAETDARMKLSHTNEAWALIEIALMKIIS